VLIRLLHCCLLLSLPAEAAWQNEWTSPHGSLLASIHLDDDGRLWYQVFHQQVAVIQPSPLGICREDACFEHGLALMSDPVTGTVTDSYRMWVGKQKQVRYRANELYLTLQNLDGQPLGLRMRLSDDGLAYRYEFPGASEELRTVLSENSGVHFFPGTRAWLQSKAEAQSGWMNTNPSYEEDFQQDIPVGTPSPSTSGWVYPALFRYRGTWIVLSETGMNGNYCGSNLSPFSANGLYRIRFPDPDEVTTGGAMLPRSRLPFHSPWRLVLAGDLATIMNSTLGTDLAPANTLKDTSFIKPGIAAWSWGLLKDDATVYPIQARFVDYAAEMNWPYVLVDAGWDRKIGYPDMASLAEYAASLNVSLLLWYNSSGAWNQTVYSPKSKLLTRADRRKVFARLQAMGIRGVKVDFFPGDGQSVFQYYLDILSDAAEFGLLVNFHGTTLPRGMQRTYPNLMTMEAVKGFEMITFSQEFADREATHSAMLPFTRNLFDPMDFTPMVLGEIPDIQRRTSNGFQLALPILFYSGIQHLVTTPEQMARVPEFVRKYLRELPGQWDESRFVQGQPGRFVVIARRSGERWYVAGINAEEEPKMLHLDLRFVGNSRGRLIRDGESRHTLTETAAEAGQHEILLASGTGFTMVFHP
jgi:alpha-glucosidase